MVEANRFHGEVLPGFVRYFNELGYHVDVFTHQMILDEKPFDGMDLDLRCFAINMHTLRFILALDRMKKYDYALINTLRHTEDACVPHQITFLDFFGTWPQVAKKAFGVAHDTSEIEKHLPKLEDWQGRVLMLGQFHLGHKVNAHYFGEVQHKPKNSITQFVIIGAILPEVRNHQILIDAICDLADSGLNFVVNVIGGNSLENMPAAAQKNMRVLGRLNFPDMYAALRQADFILAGLDADTPTHDRYISTGVTGTAQLCYGFEKPVLMDEKFAAFYGFSNENAVIYNRDLTQAIREAILMDDEQYQRKIKALAQLAASVREASLDTLKSLMSEV